MHFFFFSLPPNLYQIYDTDIVKYSNELEELQQLAIKIGSYGSTCKFSYDIISKFGCMKERWKDICSQIGIPSQQAEETLFLLKLFEEMLKHINSWLNGISKRLKMINLKSSEENEIKIYLKDLKVNYIVICFVFCIQFLVFLLLLFVRVFLVFFFCGQ